MATRISTTTPTITTDYAAQLIKQVKKHDDDAASQITDAVAHVLQREHISPIDQKAWMNRFLTTGKSGALRFDTAALVELLDCTDLDDDEWLLELQRLRPSDATVVGHFFYSRL